MSPESLVSENPVEAIRLPPRMPVEDLAIGDLDYGLRKRIPGLGNNGFEKILVMVQENGPRALREQGITLNLKEASSVCRVLRAENVDIQPFDFHRVMGVWSQHDERGIPYTVLATRMLLNSLVVRKVPTAQLSPEVVPSPEVPIHFKAILPDLSYSTFQTQSINQWNTTLGGMLRPNEGFTVFAAVKAVIEQDPQMGKVKALGLREWDFSKTPANFWVNENGKPSSEAREASGLVIEQIAALRGLNPGLATDFIQLLPYLTTDEFSLRPVNFWGTNFRGMLANAYQDDLVATVSDYVNHSLALAPSRENLLEFVKRDCHLRGKARSGRV